MSKMKVDTFLETLGLIMFGPISRITVCSTGTPLTDGPGAQMFRLRTWHALIGSYTEHADQDTAPSLKPSGARRRGYNEMKR